MVFTERSARAFLLYIAVLFLLKFYVWILISFLFGYSVFEDEDWFEEELDDQTYSVGKYDNSDELAEVLFYRLSKEKKPGKPKKNTKLTWKKFNA